MKASALATLTWANRRALSASDRWCPTATVWVIWFQMAMPALDTPTPAQKKAISACSGVRVLGVVVPSPPRALTSRYALVYSALVSAGGGPGRNWSPRASANGVTEGHCGVAAGSPGSSAGGGVGLGRGVGCQSPGSVPGVYGTMAADPSFARQASTSPATNCPRATPAVSAGPSVISPR